MRLLIKYVILLYLLFYLVKLFYKWLEIDGLLWYLLYYFCYSTYYCLLGFYSICNSFHFFFMIIHCISCNFFNTEFHWNKLNFISLPYSQRMRFLKKYFNTELESLYLLFLSKYEYSNTTLEWLKINFNNRALVHLGNGIWGRLRYTAPMLLGLSVTPADKGCVRQ